MRIFFLVNILLLGKIVNASEHDFLPTNFFSDSVLKNKNAPDSTMSFLYKADVRFFRKEMGGLLLIKNIQDSNYRIVFASATGVKFFDIAIQEDSYEIIYMVEKLRNERLIGRLVSYFQLILWSNKNLKSTFVTQMNTSTQKIYRQKALHKTIYYYCDTVSNRLKRIETKEILSRKLKINIEKNTVNEFESAIIWDPKFHLKIELTQLQR